MNNILKITVLSFMAAACLPAVAYASDNKVNEVIENITLGRKFQTVEDLLFMDEVLSKEFNFKSMQVLAIKNKFLDMLRTIEDTNHLLHARCDYSNDEILTVLYALKAENYQIPQRGLPGTFVNVFMSKLESNSNS